MRDEFTAELDFKSTRSLKELAQGEATIEDVGEYVDKTIYRSNDDVVRGFKFGFSENGGVIATKQGDEFWMDENGQDVFLKVQADAETHGALPIETETVTLNDGRTLEFTKEPIHQLVDGQIQIGQPIVDFATLDDAKKTEDVLRSITFTKTRELVSDSIVGEISATEKSEFMIHNPFVDTAHLKVNEGIPSLLSTMREVDLSKRKRELTTAKTIKSEDLKKHDFRYVTKISKENL